MRFARVSILAALAVVVSCGDSTSPDLTISGSASFSFTGGGGGTFSATGGISTADINSSTAPYAKNFAAGFTNNTDNSTNVVANVPTTAGLSNLLVVTYKGQTAGTGTINSTCNSTSTISCNDVFFEIGQNAGGSSYSYICFTTSGTVTITSISSTTITGSFSGSGTCISSGGVSTAFTVTNGTFSVPLLPVTPKIA